MPRAARGESSRKNLLLKETLSKSLARFFTMKNLFKVAVYAVKTRFFTVLFALRANKSAYPAVALNKSALT